ncbi:MAG: SDR family oxidoreductase [Planctomycetota bacterium]|nr:SDR family oxidoreductase [Planctomycetota bacterium]
MVHVVITGGAGFLGSHLCDAYLARGARVTAVDNLVTGSYDNILHLEGNSAFEFINRDVSDGFGVNGPVDAVLHFASPASPIGYLRLPIQTLKVGAMGTHNALGLARAKGAKFLVASTSEIYGDPAVTPQPEEYWGNVNTIGPRGCYDEAKRFAEAMTVAYRKVHGLDTQIVRIFNTYGPRMALDDGRALPAFVCAALRGEPLRVFGDGTQTRSFCYVDDTVRGIMTLLAKGDGSPVNVGSPGEMSILEFAHLIRELAGSESEIIHEAAMQDDPQRREPVIDRARALGWQPEVPLREGLTRTIAWFREKLGVATVAD